MLPAALALLLQSATPPPAASNEVLVIGQRAEKLLAACLARDCPPAEEIEASLQASVEQFADGRYQDARRTLLNAIRRNRDHAAALPGPVSSHYATLATVAEHEGDVKLWLSSSRNNVLVLRRHAGADNGATLGQELAFGDSMVGLGKPKEAARGYRDTQRKAANSGQALLAAGAAFRRAWLALHRGRDREAERIADEAVAIAGPESPLIADLREILRMRIAIKRGDEGAVDALAARLRQSAKEAPRLMVASALEDINPGRLGVGRSSGIRFADVGYWIRPDGRTAEPEVLRNSGLGQWASALLRQVSSRRYVPLAVEPGHPGLFRIDRFTVRGTLGVSTGSRIVQRMGDLSVHIIDLTETEAMNAAHRRRTEDALRD